MKDGIELLWSYYTNIFWESFDKLMIASANELTVNFEFDAPDSFMVISLIKFDGYLVCTGFVDSYVHCTLKYAVCEQFIC